MKKYLTITINKYNGVIKKISGVNYALAFRKIIFSLLFLFSFYAAYHFSFVTDPQNGLTSIWLAFAVLSLCFGYPEIADSVTFLGNSIKMREMKQTAHELKEITRTMAYLMMENIQGQGRWGGIKLDNKEAYKEQVTTALKNSGFEDQEIEKIFLGWHRWVLFDYANQISKVLKRTNNSWTNDTSEAYRKINQPHKSANSDEIRDFCERNNLSIEAAQDYLQEMNYYENHKIHKNFSKWTELYEQR